VASMKRRGFLVLVAATVAGGGRALAAEREMLVFAAASLTDALEEIGAAYEKEAGVRVTFAFGGSGDLARQIRAGAPAEVFVSADLVRVDQLQREGRVAERVALLSNRLVVVVPAGSSLVVRGPADLRAVQRLALADPEAVPAGAYAREWLEKVRLWAEVRERVVPTLDVRAALAAVESAAADAGIVYRTDALWSKRVRVAYEVQATEAPRIVYPAALLAGASPAARGFYAWLRSTEAKAVFVRLGFAILETPGP